MIAAAARRVLHHAVLRLACCALRAADLMCAIADTADALNGNMSWNTPMAFACSAGSTSSAAASNSLQGRSEPIPGPDVAGASPVPAQMWRARARFVRQLQLLHKDVAPRGVGPARIVHSDVSPQHRRFCVRRVHLLLRSNPEARRSTVVS
jgi:hypothetical protein